MIEVQEAGVFSFSCWASAGLRRVAWSALPPRVDVYEGSGKARTDIFSTKYTDGESGLVYYGYRYLNASTGRWLSRDLMEESGGLNLYGFANNDAIDNWDDLGLITGSFIGPTITIGNPSTATTQWNENLTYQCKREGWFNPVFNLAINWDFRSVILVKAANHPFWQATPAQVNFVNPTLQAAWGAATDYASRYNAIIAHEQLHVADQRVFYNAFKDKLTQAKVEGGYCTKKECQEVGDKWKTSARNERIAAVAASNASHH